MTGRDVELAAAAIEDRLERRPEIFLTLGSGLAGVADAIEGAVDLPAEAVPGLPAPAVPGHAGLLRAGRLGGREVLAQLGRVHLYEGYPAALVTRAVEAAARVGCTTFVVTNASGGVHAGLAPGDLLAVVDQLNLTGTSPLVGRLEAGRPAFIDMTAAYDPRLVDLAAAAAEREGAGLKTGVYAGLPGPAYETPAEVRMLHTLGADVVGMSTVLEVIAARARGMRVLGLSVVTNVHGADAATSHEEVLAVGRAAGERLGRLLLGTIPQL
jgi:purine-nucleoside phosphorylase